MNDKIKACCENCGKCDKSDFRCSQTGSLVNKCEYCSYYYGDGQTPDQRITELEAELAKCKFVPIVESDFSDYGRCERGIYSLFTSVRRGEACCGFDSSVSLFKIIVRDDEPNIDCLGLEFSSLEELNAWLEKMVRTWRVR